MLFGPVCPTIRSRLGSDKARDLVVRMRLGSDTARDLVVRMRLGSDKARDLIVGHTGPNSTLLWSQNRPTMRFSPPTIDFSEVQTNKVLKQTNYSHRYS